MMSDEIFIGLEDHPKVDWKSVSGLNNDCLLRCIIELEGLISNPSKLRRAVLEFIGNLTDDWVSEVREEMEESQTAGLSSIRAFSLMFKTNYTVYGWVDNKMARWEVGSDFNKKKMLRNKENHWYWFDYNRSIKSESIRSCSSSNKRSREQRSSTFKVTELMIKTLSESKEESLAKLLTVKLKLTEGVDHEDIINFESYRKSKGYHILYITVDDEIGKLGDPVTIKQQNLESLPLSGPTLRLIKWKKHSTCLWSVDFDYYHTDLYDLSREAIVFTSFHDLMCNYSRQMLGRRAKTIEARLGNLESVYNIQTLDQISKIVGKVINVCSERMYSGKFHIIYSTSNMCRAQFTRSIWVEIGSNWRMLEFGKKDRQPITYEITPTILTPIRPGKFCRQQLSSDRMLQLLTKSNKLHGCISEIRTSRHMTFEPDSKPDVKEYNYNGLINNCYEFSIKQVGGNNERDKYVPETEISIKIGDLNNFKHDFTFKQLSAETDVSFKSVGLGLGDSDDFLTPDYLNVIGDEVYCVEFTTRASSSDATLTRAFSEKEWKYLEALRTRCQRLNLKGYFFILVVTMDRIFSNIDLLNTHSITEELIYRYKTSRSLYEAVKESNDYIESSDDLSKAENKILQTFSNIRIERENWAFSKGLIDDKLIQNCTRPCIEDDYNNVRRILNNATRDYKESFKQFKTEKGDVSMIELLKRDIRNKQMENEQIWFSSQDNYHTRTDMKAVVQIPFLLPKLQNETNIEELEKDLESIMCADPIFNVWKKSLNSRCHRNEILKEETQVPEEKTVWSKSPTKSEGEMTEEEKLIKKYRRSRDRAVYDISNVDSVELAKVGWNAKKFIKGQSSMIIEEYRNKKKAAFDLRTNCDDITNFLSCSKELLLSNLWQFSEDSRCNDVNELIETARNLHGSEDSKLSINLTQSYQKSYIGLFLRFVSDLGTELACQLKHSCSRNEVNIRKMKYFPIWIMSRPTGLNNILSFSLLWNDRDCYSESINTGFIFKKIRRAANYCYTEPVTTNVSKLENLIRSEACGLTYCSHFLEMYSCSPDRNKSLKEMFEESNDALTMVNLTMILLLNDKHSAEEIITSMRFIHMESLVCFPASMEPGKILKKMSPVLRSRLDVWLADRCVRLSRQYSEETPSIIPRVNDEKTMESVRIWSCFLNPFIERSGSLVYLQNQDQMVGLNYLGYVVNKDQKAEKNSSSSLIEKIVVFEEQMPRNDRGEFDRRFLGREEPNADDLCKHTFSTSFLKVVVNEWKRKLERNGGVNFENVLNQQILKRLTHEYLDSFSTLKASSNFGPEYYSYDQMKTYHRSKVLEKMVDMLDNTKDKKNEKVLVTDFLLESLKDLEDSECLDIDIFKKPQHNGTREIYVLGIKARVVQKVLEDISRTVLSWSESETMTHPKNKQSIPIRHNNKAKRLYGDKYTTYSTSDDASKWSQGHYVTKFMIMMCSILPKHYHGFIIRSLSLWLNKKIKIPDDLLNIFKTADKMNTSNLFTQYLFDSYKLKPNRVDLSWHKPGTAYIKTESGMMQGILHYTSSVLHTVYLDVLRDWASYDINNKLQEIGLKNVCVVDNLQSSDDSSMWVSIPKTGDVDLDSKLAFKVHFWLKIKSILSPWLGIYPSDKSTTFTRFVMEFNSDFYFFGDTHRPTFRWVNACLSVSEQENLMSRQEEAYNLVSTIISGGGSLFLASVCQISQALLHYRILGSSVSPMWELLAYKLKNSFDPALGFFLMDHPLSTGIPGLDYLVWIAVTETNLGHKYKKMFTMEIENKTPDSRKDILLENTTIGLFSRSAMISYGTNKKFNSIVDKSFSDKDYQKMISEDPELLYRKAKTTEDTKLKLWVKIQSPGVIASLGKKNCISRIVASSIYISSRDVISSVSKFYNSNQRKSKSSLLGHLFQSSLVMSKERAKHNFDLGYQISVNPDFTTTIFSGKLTDEKIMEWVESCSSLHIPISFKDATREWLINKNGDVLSELEYFAIANDLGFVFYKPSVVSGNVFWKVTRTICSNNERYVFHIGRDNDRTLLLVPDKPIDDAPLRFSHKEMKVIFPSYKDYETLRDLLRTCSCKHTTKQTNFRRRQQSDIIITTKWDESSITAEEVMKHYWFPNLRSQISDTTAEVLFRYYKNMVPWLSIRYKETLENSPFSDDIQLQNSLSRLDKKTRVVHLLGSYGKVRNKIMNLATVIKNNFSNGLSFSDIYDHRSKQRSQEVNTYMHLLTLLPLLPCKKEYIDKLMCDLLTKGPPLDEDSMPGSRINKVIAFRRFLNTCPVMKWTPHKTMQELLEEKCVSMGVIPSYKEANEMARIKMEEWQNAYQGSVDTNSVSFMDFLQNYEDALSDDSLAACLADHYYLGEVPLEVYEREMENLIQNHAPDEEFVKKYKNTNVMRWWFEGLISDEQDVIVKLEEFENSKQIISEQMRNYKIGSFGSFTKRQKWNLELSIYEGCGEWVGWLNDAAVKIEFHCENFMTVISKVTVKHVTNWKQLFLNLKYWAKENYIQNNELSFKSLQHSKLITHMVNFEESNNKFGCPVVLDNLLKPELSLTFSTFDIELTEHAIRLVGHYDDTKDLGAKFNKATLLSIPLNLHNVLTDVREIEFEAFNFLFSEMSPLKKSWLRYEVLDLNGLSELNTILTNTNRRNQLFYSDSIEEWSCDFWRKLMERSSGIYDPKIEIDEIIIHKNEKILDDRIKSIIDSVNNIDDDNINSIMIDLTSKPISEEDGVLVLEALAEEIASLEVVTRESRDIFMIHPLLKGVFVKVEECECIKMQHDDMLQIPAKYLNFVELLKKLWGISKVVMIEPETVKPLSDY